MREGEGEGEGTERKRKTRRIGDLIGTRRGGGAIMSRGVVELSGWVLR